MSIRTPLARVRGLGSAKRGSEHFWLQRLTAVANIILGLFLVGLIAHLIGKDHAYVRSLLANPLISVLLLLLIVSGTVHMRLGMQTIIEDYVHAEGLKVIALILNTFFAIFVAAVSVFSILKLGFGT
jgi:succinate dehydrogenase / fumarate reductase membrane anchor subunit